MAETKTFVIQPDLFLLNEDHRPFVVNKSGHLGIPFPPFSMRFAAAIGTIVISLALLLETFGSDNSPRRNNNLAFWGIVVAFGVIYFLRLSIRYRNLRRLETEGQLIDARFIEARKTYNGKQRTVEVLVTFTNPENNEIMKKKFLVMALDLSLGKAVMELKPETQMVVLYRNKRHNIIL